MAQIENRVGLKATAKLLLELRFFGFQRCATGEGVCLLLPVPSSLADLCTMFLCSEQVFRVEISFPSNAGSSLHCVTVQTLVLSFVTLSVPTERETQNALNGDPRNCKHPLINIHEGGLNRKPATFAQLFGNALLDVTRLCFCRSVCTVHPVRRHGSLIVSLCARREGLHLFGLSWHWCMAFLMCFSANKRGERNSAMASSSISWPSVIMPSCSRSYTANMQIGT